MTLKNRIDKLEQRADDQGSFGNRYAEWLRAERIRLLNDREAIERLQLEALREDDPEGYARCMAQRAKTGLDSSPLWPNAVE